MHVKTPHLFFRNAHLAYDELERTEGEMGAFLLGLIIGVAGSLALFIYDEGEVFLKLSQQIKRTAEKYKQQA